MVKISIMAMRNEAGTLVLKLDKRLEKDDFLKLLRMGFLYKEEEENDSGVPPGWYVDAEPEQLEKFDFELAPEIKEIIEAERIRKMKMDETWAKMKKMERYCPRCKRRLYVSGATEHMRGLLSCPEECDYDEVWDVSDEPRLVDAGYVDEKDEEYGFTLWYYPLLDGFTVEEAKKLHEKEDLAFCEICMTTLNAESFLDHLKRAHGCDV